MKAIVLINPPVAKPSEPPAGIARLAGFLRQNDVDCRVIDANIGGMDFVLNRPVPAEDTWTRRAVKNRSRHLRALQTRSGYTNFDRYKRAVADIGRVLEKAEPHQRVKIGLANYQDRDLSPVRSQDLLKAAARPEVNPFYDYYREAILPAAMDPAIAAVGISLGFLSQALCGFALIGLLKRERPDLDIILGGGLMTSYKPSYKCSFTVPVEIVVEGKEEDDTALDNFDIELERDD